MDKIKSSQFADLAYYCRTPPPLLPSEYQQVEYLQCSGSQYINTGFNPTGASGVNIELGDITQNSCLFGAYNQAWGVGFGMWCNADNRQDFWYHYISNTQIKVAPPSRFTMLFEKGTTYIDGVQVATVAEKTFTINYPLFLLAGNDRGSANSATTCKLYQAQVYDNGTLVRNCWPCYRKSDSTPGMYDLVTSTFYTNGGTGDFTVGGNV